MNRLDALAPHWGEISALLDEALALPASERARWLDTLGGESARFKATLLELLASQAGVETGDFLGTLPHIDAGATLQDNEPAAGREVGPYRLLRAIGHGGMGAVWLAERSDGTLKRHVALKLPHAAWGAALGQRFARERDILSQLEHPHIARLYDAGVDVQGRPFFAMEFVEGQAIDVYCRERNTPLRERLGLLLQVCAAVAHAHSRLVVHRDLKPGNILVTADGQVKLLDFGIAKLMEGDRAEETALTREGGRALTLDYASPEQIAGAPLGTASDVYSLGVVAYELLAGQRPYQLKRGSAAELEEAIAQADAARASDRAATPALKRQLRGDLDAILAHALAKQPGDRYASMAEFAADLLRHRDGQPVMARPDRHGYRMRKFIVRNRLAVSAGATIALTLVAASVVSLWQAREARQQAQRALAVQGFITDIFRTNSDTQGDPIKARLTTARELLDIGAARINDNLQADPEGRAQMLEQLGDMYYDLGLDARAADFYGQRAQSLKQAFGPRDRRVARALSDYARQLEPLARHQEQSAALDEAKAILDALGDTDSEDRAQLLDSMGLAQAHSGRRAVELAEQAVAIYRRRAPQSEAFAPVLNRLGMALWRIDKLPEAEAALSESIALAERNPKAGVSALMTGMLTLASAQSLQHKVGATERTYRRALALTLARNGPTHVDTLHTQVRFAWFLHRTARREEAWQLLNAAQGELGQRQYPQQAVRAVRQHVTQALMAEGRFDEAEQPVDWVLAQYASVDGGKSTLHIGGLRLQAEQRLGQGRLNEAAAAVAKARAVMADALSEEQRRTVANSIALVAARIALAQGDAAAALEEAAQVTTRGAIDAVLPVDALRAQALRAEALLRLRRDEQARSVAQTALDAISASALRDSFPTLEAEALRPLGRALLTQGSFDAACAALSRAVNLRRVAQGEHSAPAAEAAREHAQCMLARERAAAASQPVVQRAMPGR